MLLSVDEGLMSYAPLKLIVKSSNEGLPALLGSVSRGCWPCWQWHCVIFCVRVG